MYKSLVLISALLCILIGCEPPKNQRASETAGLKYDTSQIAILPWIDRSHPFRDSGFKPAELTQRDLEVIDSLFLASVNIHNQGRPLTSEDDGFGINLAKRNYRRQLVAVENTKGEKIVWVNCFCTTDVGEWKTTIVSVDDGGSYFFNFRINLTEKTFSNFSVNGLA